MGLPIYGICAYVNSALKLKELSELIKDNSQKDVEKSLSNYENRKKMLNNIKSHIKNTTNDDFINYLNKYFGHDFYKNDKKISHLIGALSVWDLTIDDIMLGVYNNYYYDNNIKDSTIIQKQLQYLGRNNGNLLPIITPDHKLYSNSLY